MYPILHLNIYIIYIYIFYIYIYIIFSSIAEGHIFGTPSNNTYKDFIMVLLYYVFVHDIITLQKAIYIYIYTYIHLPSPKTIRMKVLYNVICSSIIFIADGYIYIYIFATPSNNTYKAPIMNIFSPPARWGLLDFIRAVVLLLLRLLLLQFLLDHVCINFHYHFRLAKLFANFRAQCALLDLNLGPSQLSAHCWTSTWDLPSSVRTAGPQPGTFPAQVSAHRWTSTWDLPSSVRTAGPQPGTFPAQCAPLDLNLGPSQLRWVRTAGPQPGTFPAQCAPLDLNLGPP